MKVVREHFGESLRAWVSTAHLDESVKTDPDVGWYEFVRMYRGAGGRFFVQRDHLFAALAVRVLVVDLNPRSISAWVLLIVRRLLRRRTLVWGHMHPQAGPSSSTAHLRIAMRRLSSGAISYTYRDRHRAHVSLPQKPIWVAPNAVHSASEMVVHTDRERRCAIYVGRFAPGKKVELLVRAFAIATARGVDATLLLVGSGECERELRSLIDSLGIRGRVEMPGWISDSTELAEAYARSFVSVSPGFAGLSLTQSLGFGVPMVVARDEPHSPEIELESTGGVSYFASGAPEALASELIGAWQRRQALPLQHVARSVSERYSAEAMAEGLIAALEEATEVEGELSRDH